jgi:HAD superfamily hydrolase (TIGR01509 family)
MLRGVLFDWGNTLVRFEWDDALLAEGHRAGLSALGREREAVEFTRRFRDEVLPGMSEDDAYASSLRTLLGDVSDEDVDRFVDAEHEAWRPAHTLLSAAPGLLDALRERGLATGIVGNAWPEPGRVLRADLARHGLLDRLDVVVFSSDLGVRKPDARLFRRALEALGVAPAEALFVGDRVEQDVRGAAAVGMKTMQAVWFNADPDGDGGEADFVGVNPYDVLTVARRLA